MRLRRISVRRRCRREAIVLITVQTGWIEASHEAIFIRCGIRALTQNHKFSDSNCINKGYERPRSRSIASGIHLSH